MIVNEKILRIMHYAAVIVLIASLIDPMEGSVTITIASAVLAIVAYQRNSKYKNHFIVAFILCLIGVSILFIFSAMGGIGGDSGRSIWLALFILPYPTGWLVAVISLILSYFNQKN